MKKTTYILIALIAVLGVAAFVAPPLTLKRMATMVTVMRGSDTTVTISAGVTTKLTISTFGWHDMMSLEDSTRVHPTVVVREVPGIEDTRIRATKEWSRQFTVYDGESCLDVTLDFHGIERQGEKGTQHVIYIAPDNMVMCSIEVPEGSLRRLGADLPVNLEWLTGDSLTIERQCGVDMRGCTVRNVIL
ncbi:MAG: hypothetical protein K2O24_08275 [Muribaculaceae bacterium]|nr:hypothetical protein [Muribaculaceae bacterium]